MMASASLPSSEGQSSVGGNRMTESRCSITDLTLEQALARIKEIEDENRAHRDNLREHNAMMREQCENLVLWRKRENEKFEQAKALITALRGENQDMQVQIMTLKDKEKETAAQLSELSEQKSHLLRQKALSEQQIFNLLKQAEEQGVKGLEADAENGGALQSCDDTEGIVFVSTSEKEAEIAKLEASVASKEEIIAQLRSSQIKRDQEVEDMRKTTQQLLKDMQNQQHLKDSIEEENRSLTQRLLQAEKQMHQQMQSAIASTKREMQTPLQSSRKEDKLPTLVTENETGDAEGAERLVVSYPDNPEDVIDTIQSLDAEKQRKQMKRDLERKVEEAEHAKQDLQKEVENLTSKVEQLELELNQQRQEAVEIQGRADTDIKELTQQYEVKLKEVVQQSRQHENQSMQATTTGDMSLLRSQVLTLIREVDEVNTKNSALTATIHVKDTRIQELEEHKRTLIAERAALMQEQSRLLQNLHNLNVQQERAQQENVKIKQQYQQLQDSFSSLVTDYKDLQEMFETKFQAQKQQAEEKARNPSRQMMEEINRLTAQVIAAEQAMMHKDEELAKLRAADEELEVFKIQAELYKGDFNAERESRTKLAEELNALREENRLLKEERDLYSQQQIHSMQTRHTGVSNPPSWPYAPPGSANMMVPPRAGPNLPILQYPGQPNGTLSYPGVPNGQYPASQNVHYREARPGSGGVVPGAGAIAAAPGGVREEDLRSFQQYECPFCRAQFPDEDTVQLHVTECADKD
ncbi:NF-kappa-b essential modulator [Plakobranchus ocellatus]|uniref:NF-kappa-b essential modulator n=1 Tax=Plakobranchus ocellatus TaxID=259542 RepID=A0AAV3YB08_9GAST|nr:NF-kappa-b essential modulator [Plakobranchus ocellatus]